MRVIKLMADYDSFPLWEASPGQVGNIDPRDLPISAGLRARLAKWAGDFDATLDRDDPIESGFQSEEAEADFSQTGRDLRQQLEEELGPAFSVILKL